MKRLMLALAILGYGVLFAETVKVSNVADLVSELKRLNGGANEIQLETGDYTLPDEAMGTDGNGSGAIYVNKVKLIGLGGKPEDVKLIGNGKIRAVLTTSTAWLESLMVTNGYASGSSNAGRGGGVYGAGTITNCVITGCQAVLGGAVSSCANLLDSRFEGNSAGNGGAFHVGSVTTMIGCTFKNNATTGSGTGGAGYLGAKLTARDCAFIDNSAATGGAIYQNNGATTVSNCVFSGNSATNGGAVSGRTAEESTAQVEFLDCIITNNTASSNGGGCNGRCTVRGGVVSGNTAGSGGGGLYNASAYGCRILDNKANFGGGCAGSSVYDKCIIAGNIVTSGGGGGLYFSSAFDCVISNNFANGSSGGGIYNSSTDSNEQIVSNCLVYANRCGSGASHVNGGGIYCGTDAVRIIDCEVAGNYSMTVENTGRSGLTGGILKGTIIGGSVHDNYADSDCGGCREGVAIGCRIYNNDCGGKPGKNCYSMRLIDCDISDNLVSYGSAYGCTFHDVVDGRAHTLTNNPFKSDHTYDSVLAVWNYHVNATNCLFRGNKGAMFMGTTAGGVKASLVNCTVTDNEIASTFHTFMDPNNLLTVVNSAFVGNTNAKTGAPCDIVLTTCKKDGTPGLSFANCIYGATAAADIADYAPDPSTLYQLGQDGIPSSPRFNKDGEYPYEPKYSSPLVGRGQVMDWMTGAYDIRGDIDDGKYLRLRDGKADIGCYQCWLDPVGMMLLLR